MSWPGLTTQLIKKHVPTNVHTELGHIKAERQGLRSNKTPKTYDSIYTIIHNIDKTFMELTGHFLYKSSRGNEYILIACNVDSNAILGTQIKKTSKYYYTSIDQTRKCPFTLQCIYKYMDFR